MPGQSHNKTCLHLVVTSRAEAVTRCADQIVDGDAVVFLDDGVMQFALPGQLGHLQLDQAHFLKPDLEARGLPTTSSEQGWAVISDSEFVDMLELHPHCLTWK